MRTEEKMPSHFWFNREALTTGKLNRYFNLAAWAEIPLIIGCLFVWYCWYSTSLGRITPLEQPLVKILLGLIGACGALGGIFLSKGMWEFWKSYDSSPERSKKA
jgi:hypothetical protein